MKRNNPTQTVFKELETASRSFYEAENFANSIPTNEMLSAPNYLKERIRQKTVLERPLNAISRSRQDRFKLFYYSLRVCFAMCCSLIVLFSDYTADSTFAFVGRSPRFEQTEQKNSVHSALPITNSMEDSYYD